MLIPFQTTNVDFDTLSPEEKASFSRYDSYSEEHPLLMEGDPYDTQIVGFVTTQDRKNGG